jgi:hypothetical protein
MGEKYNDPLEDVKDFFKILSGLGNALSGVQRSL